MIWITSGFGCNGSVYQPHHSSPFHSIKSVHDVIPVENGKQVLHGARCIALSRLDVFPKDAPGVFDGA